MAEGFQLVQQHHDGGLEDYVVVTTTQGNCRLSLPNYMIQSFSDK